MALTRLCLVVQRDCNNLQELLAPLSFQIICLLLREMPVSWNAKANLLLLICMSSLSRSAPSCQQGLRLAHASAAGGSKPAAAHSLWDRHHLQPCSSSQQSSEIPRELLSSPIWRLLSELPGL